MKNKENLHLCHHPHLSLDLLCPRDLSCQTRGRSFQTRDRFCQTRQRRVEQTLSILTTTIPIFVQKPDRSCQTRVICLLIFFVLGTDLVKLGRVEQTRSNIVTVGHSQIWTSLTQLRPNWYLDRRPLASHYKNNPSQISPSRPLGVVMVILIPLLFEQQLLSFSPNTSGPRKLWLLRDNNDRFSPYNKEGAT